MVAPVRESARRRLLAAAIVMAAVGADQYGKHLARELLPEAGAIRLLGGLLVLRYAENPGAFLGLGSTWHPLLRAAVFGILSLAVVAAAAVYLFRDGRLELARSCGLALVVGGGIGNLIDRVARGGYVTDFLNLGIGRLRTGIFNLADLFLMAGAALFLLAAPPQGPQGTQSPPG